MGNVYGTIKYYLGFDDNILTPKELSDQASEIKADMVEEEIKILKKELDRNRDNIVTKDELNHYFEILASRIDKNKDNVITHDELEIYVSEQLEKSKQEIEKWKTAYKQIHNRYETLLDKLRDEETRTIEVSQISSQALKDYIKTEIIDTDTNLRLIPDPIEKKIYLTVYKTILKSLEGVFNTTSVDLLNHRVSFAIQPIPIEKRKTKLKKSKGKK